NCVIKTGSRFRFCMFRHRGGDRLLNQRFQLYSSEFLQRYDKSPAILQAMVVIVSSIVSRDIPILAGNFHDMAYDTSIWQQHINQGLTELNFPAKPVTLYEPMRYMLTLGGKRIRPLLTLMAADLFS